VAVSPAPETSIWRTLTEPYRGLDRRIWAIAATRMVNTMGFSIVMPFMAMWMVKSRHVLAARVGIIYLVAGIVAAASQGLAGELSDRFGRRRIMVAALALRALNMVALGVAVTREASILTLAGLIVLYGVLRATFEPAAGDAVTDLAPEGQRVAAFGLQRIGINLAWSIGPMLGGIFTGHGFGSLFFFAAPTLLAAAVVASRIPDLPRRRMTDPAIRIARGERAGVAALVDALRHNPPFFICLVLVLFGSLLTTQLFATLTTYLGAELRYPESTIGLVYTINGVLVVLLQVPAVTLIRRGGARVALVVGPLTYTISYFLIGQSDAFVWIAACVAFLTFGEVIFSPALSDLAIYLGDPKRYGRSFGLFGFMQTLGISLGPLVGGTIFDHLRHHHAAMWSSLAIMMACVTVAYAFFGRRYAVRMI
jgi:MFS family permease